MRPYERLSEERRNSRRTIADAIEVLRDKAGFAKDDHAQIRIGPTPGACQMVKKSLRQSPTDSKSYSGRYHLLVPAPLTRLKAGPGTPNKTTAIISAAMNAVAANAALHPAAIIPLEFMLGMMADPNVDPFLRFKAAQAAAPSSNGAYPAASQGYPWPPGPGTSAYPPRPPPAAHGPQ
jgi:hypothetical protein